MNPPKATATPPGRDKRQRRPGQGADACEATATKRLVIVVRADPVICGHSGEARNLAEAALQRGFDDVRIITWPIEALGNLPLKPQSSVLPYSPGITVERPEPVGDYKVPDGRFVAGMVGRLVELFTDGVPTTAMSLYLMPHANVIVEALHIARSLGKSVDVTTVAEAVGSDITNIVRTSVEEGRFGAAAQVFATYLAHDRCVAVSEYTKQLIVESAEAVDTGFGTSFADECRRRVTISYPAVNARTFTEVDDGDIDAALAARGLERDGYVLFLSRLTPAKGVDDLIEGFVRSCVSSTRTLVVAGTGAAASDLRAQAAATGLGDRIRFFDDVDDDEKRKLLAGSAAYVLASKPKQEFVETFGIALVEKMLAGGGPVITTATGGIPEAVGDCAIVIPPESPAAIADALDEALLVLSPAERAARADKARTFALQFDRLNVFDRLFASSRASQRAHA